LNEKRFASACGKAANCLREARKYTDNVGFLIYLDAKIEELLSGSEEARRVADYLWIRHDSPVDIIISSALEVYLDNWKNLKGAAAGCVTLKDRKAEALLEKILACVSDMEQAAPWKNRRLEIDPESLPKLTFVNVATWSGDYLGSPLTTFAQSLPNDEWVAKTIGTVNMVYTNIVEILFRISGILVPKEFFPGEVMSKYGDLLMDGLLVHGALHEIGHTTGCQDPDHLGKPSSYFDAEYSWLEETRAELFAMWSARYLAGTRVLPLSLAEACQYSMLESIIRALKFEPEQAHNRARIIIYHYLLEHGGVLKTGSEGKYLLSLDLEKTYPLVEELLGRIGDIKASGDKAQALNIKEKYCYTDDLKEEIAERTKDFPQGTGIIFPELGRADGNFTNEISYPRFVDQKKFQ
jgi:hypothetical protein